MNGLVFLGILIPGEALAAYAAVRLWGALDRRLQRRAAAVERPVDYWPATERTGNEPFRTVRDEADVQQSVDVANSWTALDELQARRAMRNHHTTN